MEISVSTQISIQMQMQNKAFFRHTSFEKVNHPRPSLEEITTDYIFTKRKMLQSIKNNNEQMLFLYDT